MPKRLKFAVNPTFFLFFFFFLANIGANVPPSTRLKVELEAKLPNVGSRVLLSQLCTAVRAPPPGFLRVEVC